MEKVKFEQSIQDGVHSKLAAMAGNWTGTCKVWFGPDTLADESAVEASIRPALGGRFLIHEYRSTFQGKPLEGIALIGFDLSSNEYQLAWADSFHMSTGIMFSVGKNDDGLQVLGSYSGGEPAERWGWQTEIGLDVNDRLIMTAYNISPAGESVKATEAIFTRT